ncbi:MAG TPA: HAMP domain-containing sensor histidine kinase, partial [Candidatus Saccharimonadia bacterium]|nr:HAMP domain-containing sensor histidine kinase [Candidatus Saccharimonadia bacterium]
PDDQAAIINSLDQGKAVMDEIDSQAATIEAAQAAQVSHDRTNVQRLSDISRDISVVTLVLTLALAVSVYYLYLKAIQAERQLDRAKDEFVSLASHQLRTPATGIKSILSTLVAGDFGSLNERQAYFLRRALESNERELSIIEELLNVAKADAGRLILNPSSFEVGKLINLIADEQRGSIEEKRQELAIRLPRRPLRMHGDEEKLYMAIGNLLDNARKYTPELGKITITVSKHYNDIHIEVADTGIGIDTDEIAHIFDRFQRAQHAMQGNTEGVGLGLYLARRVGELHGGLLEVSSKLGKGTKFVMILPQGDYDNASASPGARS